jgi:hypothetical protein
VRNAWGDIMRKLALLLAAALVLAAPLSATMSSLTYAAGKAKKAAKRTLPAKRMVTEETSKETDPMEANTRFARTLGDLSRQLATYRYIYDPATGGDAKGGKQCQKSEVGALVHALLESNKLGDRTALCRDRPHSLDLQCKGLGSLWSVDLHDHRLPRCGCSGSA